jgi:hypothetical protein
MFSGWQCSPCYLFQVDSVLQRQRCSTMRSKTLVKSELMPTLWPCVDWKKKVWLKKTLHCHDLTKLSSPRSDLWLVLVQAMLKMNRGLVVATNPNSGDAVAETTCAPRNCCRLGPVQCKVCAHGFHPGILRELAPPGGHRSLTVPLAVRFDVSVNSA